MLIVADTMTLSSLLRPIPLFLLALLLRLTLLFYGIYQDAHSALKYTDIDYLVFTDAARYVSHSESAYLRDTYRYTPLLAWLLVPTSWPGFFSFGKVIFAGSDLLAGWFIIKLLQARGMNSQRAGAFAAIWLWNPMVATISTRGSSEGLLGVLVMGLLWTVERRRFAMAGVVLGLSVHFKIYPFIYAPAVVWWMDDGRLGKKTGPAKSPFDGAVQFFSVERITLAVASLATFAALNGAMYLM